MRVYIKNSQRSRNLNLRRFERDAFIALNLLGLGTAELSIFFVGSKKMKSLNAAYRGISKTTDVLSFPLVERSANHAFPGPSLLGDVVICVPTALRQATEFDVSFYDELLRLLLHGILHLAGYDHELNRYQKIKMEKKEKELFHAVKAMA